MPCEIKNETRRPNGPYGEVEHRGVCVTHGFRTYGEAIQGDLCPIGQIEAATEAALSKLGLTVPSSEPVNVTATEPALPDDGTQAVPPPKRTRKAKAEPDA